MLSTVLGIVVTATGILLLVGATLATQDWWDRHFLPLYFSAHAKQLLIERLARLAMAALGLALMIFVRPALRRATERKSSREIAASGLRIALAVILALAVSEWTMGRKFAFAAAETQPGEQPVRQPDPRLGWVFAPSHQGTITVGRRRISYSTDSHGYRVRGPDGPVDVTQPTLVFTGESIIAGYGLNWEETIPALAGAALQMQSANIAVFGYANDQAYLRLVSELPRFRQPRAVVSLFVPSLFARNLGDDRPHLGPRLTWMPARHRLWVHALFRFLVPYHSQPEIEQGIANMRAQLMASQALARAHGAIPLIVVPQFGPELPVEQMLRRRILDGQSYVQVQLDPDWHLQGDLHPDPRAAQAIAMAVVARLRAGFDSQR